MNPFELETSTPQYSEFIHKSRYAKWIESKKRRETWEETVDRYVSFWKDKFPDKDIPLDDIKSNIYNLKVMPSMRALMTAGKALDKDNVAGYNCAFIAINDLRVFDEIMYILMCGTGVGFSVERQYVNQLPTLSEEFYETETTIITKDSKIGWASSFKELLSLLYVGKIPSWDFSKIRKSGSRLKTFGGLASGSEPLNDLFNFTIDLCTNASGRKLTSIECHDLVCKIAEIVVVGGVRRSALISLSNLSDERMRNAKNGAWWEDNQQRALANNSVCYTEKPDIDIFIKEWLSLYQSKSGERGIYNNEATNLLIPKRRKELGHTSFGCNPCSEIILRDTGQFCNLTEVVIRSKDTLETLLNKIEIATILGTLQASITSFRYLRKQWRRNCEEEALLGVSLTGITDHSVMNGSEGYDVLKDWLKKLKNKTIIVNEEWSKKIGINRATAITCVKPSGTVSQLVDTSSGIHPRYSKYYTRTIRSDTKNPVTHMMKDQGVPNEPDITKPNSCVIFSFPVKAPEEAILRDDRSAIEQMELWKIYQLHYCEHKPSITVYVKEDEWLKVASWVYDNFDIISGISFLPHTKHSYKQAPYQEITEEQYLKDVSNSIVLDWDKLKKYEKEDTTTSSKELACFSGNCEI